MYFNPDIPKCSKCGCEMDSWDPFTEQHAHEQCIPEKIANALINEVKQHLKLCSLYRN